MENIIKLHITINSHGFNITINSILAERILSCKIPIEVLQAVGKKENI
jgi:hypothetical protein